MSIQQHPDYLSGFWDAVEGEPIWENECSAEYRAGWFAYHELREIFAR